MTAKHTENMKHTLKWAIKKELHDRFQNIYKKQNLIPCVNTYANCSSFSTKNNVQDDKANHSDFRKTQNVELNNEKEVRKPREICF